MVAASTRTFANSHEDFMVHFVGMLSRINDSFLDHLGVVDLRNINRWDARQPAGQSLLPSMVDALMLAGETFGSPSQRAVVDQRQALDLFVQQSAAVQTSCQYLGPGPGMCEQPTLQHVALQETAEFLYHQKILVSLGPLATLAGPSCCAMQHPDYNGKSEPPLAS